MNCEVYNLNFMLHFVKRCMFSKPEIHMFRINCIYLSFSEPGGLVYSRNILVGQEIKHCLKKK